MARIGEGLIYDLRSELFDRVQRLNGLLAGSLVSRLDNNVIGAQRGLAHAARWCRTSSPWSTLTGDEQQLRSGDSPVACSSSLYLARRAGRKQFATITRDGMQENAEMNNIMTERFGASSVHNGATRADPSGRAAKVRDISVNLCR
ncbi:MAG: hypothetical protein V9G12_04010 [Microthrixaceae bacterium]